MKSFSLWLLLAAALLTVIPSCSSKDDPEEEGPDTSLAGQVKGQYWYWYPSSELKISLNGEVLRIDHPWEESRTSYIEPHVQVLKVDETTVKLNIHFYPVLQHEALKEIGILIFESNRLVEDLDTVTLKPNDTPEQPYLYMFRSTDREEPVTVQEFNVSINDDILTFFIQFKSEELGEFILEGKVGRR